MLNCIIATMRPKSGMKRPSTPASFIARSTGSGEFFEVRISMKSWFAVSFLRSLSSIFFSDSVTRRVASGWIGMAWRSASQ